MCWRYSSFLRRSSASRRRWRSFFFLRSRASASFRCCSSCLRCSSSCLRCCSWRRLRSFSSWVLRSFSRCLRSFSAFSARAFSRCLRSFSARSAFFFRRAFASFSWLSCTFFSCFSTSLLCLGSTDCAWRSD